MPTPEVQTEGLQSTSETGKAPVSRLNSAASAYRIVDRMIRADDERSRKRAIIQGQIDGNPPYDADELTRLGQSGRSNTNSRQAEGIRDSRKTSYFELLFEVDTFVEVDIPGYENSEDPQLDLGEIIAEKFTDLMISWPAFWYHMMLHQEQFVTWGVGNCYWENEIDWRFKAARVGNFLIPDGTLSTIEDFECIAIPDEIRIHKLFQRVKDPETTAASKAAGWNTELIKELICKNIDTANSDSKYNLSDWESVQTSIKENDLEFGMTIFPTIKYVHLLYAEFDGKISQMMIARDQSTNDVKSSADKTQNWMFRKIGQFENWSQFCCPFMANIGEGSYHTIRGLGAKIFAHCVINDRLLNTTIDGAMASATILLQPSNDPQKERIRMVRVGPFSVMPSGYSVIPQGSFRPDLTGLIGVKNLLDANLNQNVGLFRPDVTDNEKNAQSQNQGELRMRATKEAKLEKSDINIYYTQWDNLFTEVLRRVLSPNLDKSEPGGKEAKKFIKDCVDAGVPKELMKFDKLKITSRRAIGTGSPVMRSIVTADILSVSPYFDEKGKNNAVRDYVAARGGQRAVKRYKPATDRNAIPSNDHSIAMLENNDLKEGSECQVGVDQPHVIHLMIHLRPLAELADAYQEGKVDPGMLYQYLSAALRHSSTHMDMIARDPARQNEYKQFMSMFRDLVKLHSQVEKQVMQMQKAQQKQTEDQAAIVDEARQTVQNGETQVKLEKMRGDLQLKAQKQQAQIQLNNVKASNAMQLKEIMANHDMALKEMSARTGGVSE